MISDKFNMLRPGRKNIGYRPSFVAKAAAFYFKSNWIRWIVFAISVLSIVTYIAGVSAVNSTILVENQEVIWIVFLALELFYTLVFLIDYIFSIIHAPTKLNYLLSFCGVTDLFSIFPIILIILAYLNIITRQQIFVWLGFLRVFRLLKVFQLMKVKTVELSNIDIQTSPNSESFFQLSEVFYQVTRLIISIAVFIMIATGAVFWLSESEGDNFSRELTWFDCLYFVLVTTTTVGYGDIVPTTTVARALVIVIIAVGFSIIPAQVATLAQVVLFRPKYLGELTIARNYHHVCLCGIVDYELLRRFLLEIFHPTHSLNGCNDSLMIAILSPLQPSKKVLALLNISTFRSRVKFFIGNAKSFADLDRIKAEGATAIYLIPDVVTTSLRVEEDSIFLSAISVSKYLQYTTSRRSDQLSLTRSKKRMNMPWGNSINYCNIPSSPRTIVKLTASARNKAVLKTTGIDVVLSVLEFKYGLIGFGTVWPGLLALFLNLNRAQPFKDSEINRRSYRGSKYCIYEIDLDTHQQSFSSVLRSCTYKDAVERLYMISDGRMILIAVATANKVVVNPAQLDCLIGLCEAIFVIAASYDEAINFTSFLFDEYEVDKAYFNQCKTIGRFDRAPDCMKYNDRLHEVNTSQSSASRASTKSGVSQGMIPGVQKLNPYVTSVMKDIIPQDHNNSHFINRNSRSPHVPFDLYTSDNEDTPLNNHMVLVLSSSGHLDTSASALMLPIIYFLKAVRSQSCDKIVILSERAEELIDLTPEIEEANPGLMNDTTFVCGFGRNPDHLRMCRVQYAKSVAIIRPPIAAETAEESQSVEDSARSAMVNADKNSIIASLNLHMLLQHHASSRKVFTVCEVVHEANIIFLRQGRSSPFTSDPGEDESGDGKDEVVQRGYDEELYDWPMLASGSILTHSILDALMVQAVFNPHILNLWEAMLNIGLKGRFIPKAKGQYNSFKKVTKSSEAKNQKVSKKISREDDIALHREDSSLSIPTSDNVNFNNNSKAIFPQAKSSTRFYIDATDGQEAKVDGKDGLISGDCVFEEGKDPDDDNDNDNDGDATYPTNFDEINFRRENSMGLIDLMESIQSPTTHTFAKPFVPVQYGNESIKFPPDDPCENSTGRNNGNLPKRDMDYHLGSIETILDKIRVPADFVGVTFEVLFLSMVRGIKVIPIAIYRRHLKSFAAERCKVLPSDEMPFVIVIPSPDTTLMSDDELFILR